MLCLTETWLTENDDIDSLLVPGFNNYAIKNRNRLGGGVMIQIKNDPGGVMIQEQIKIRQKSG